MKKKLDVPDNEELIPPKASALLESLRSFGYSLIDSIADLIDNSIVAKATEINVDFIWQGRESKILIADNGFGLNYEDLKNAMSLGVNGPSAARAENDLGRFGLGLKTASLSQARKMKVYSRKSKGALVGLCWDLDAVEKNNRWAAIKLLENDSSKDKIKIKNSGTVIVLEVLDRIIKEGTLIENVDERKHFYSEAEEVSLWIGMIFHRYIESDRLKILVNGNVIKSLDPLHLESDLTKILVDKEIIRSEETKAKITSVLISQQHIDSELSDKKDLTSKQGIYIYRNNRIVSYGRWAGLAGGNSSDNKYFRISLDFNSKDDKFWEIDVKKTKVKIPRSISKRLKPILKSGFSKSREILWNSTFINKNSRTTIPPLWLMGSKSGKDLLLINREHPFVKKIKEIASIKKEFEILLKMIETSLDYNQFDSKDESGQISPKDIFQQNMADLGLKESEIEKLLNSLNIPQ
jgi:hypothetical protein